MVAEGVQGSCVSGALASHSSSTFLATLKYVIQVDGGTLSVAHYAELPALRLAS